MKHLKFFFAFLLVLGSVAFWAEPGLALLQKGGIWKALIYLNAIVLSSVLAFTAKGEAKPSFSWFVKKDDQGNRLVNLFAIMFIGTLILFVLAARTFINEA